jgi:hypothetical protein
MNKKFMPSNNTKTEKSPAVFTPAAKIKATYKQQSKYSPEQLMLFFYKIFVYSSAFQGKTRGCV